MPPKELKTVTLQELYAFMALWESYVIEAMRDYSNFCKVAQERGDELDAHVKAAIVVCLDEMRKTLGKAFQETFALSIAGTLHEITTNKEKVH